MLTDLNWLSGEFPPPIEQERINTYKKNELLFLSKHSEVYKQNYDSLSRRLGKKGYDVDTIFNYQQLLSKKTADFICGEPPTIESEQDTDTLEEVLNKERFNIKLYEAFIDVTRYGNAVFKLIDDRISIVSPINWYPIVDPTDLKRIINHVIAYPINFIKGEPTELYVEIHDIGRIETRVYNFKDDEIGSLKERSIVHTGLDDFAVQVLSNTTHSGSIYGLDDYLIVNSIVGKLMWRLHCADNILDKHSDPSLSGPQSALDYDDKTGLYFLNLGNYFKRNSLEDPDVNYITWNGNLESNFKEIEKLLEQLYILSEMGQAFMEGGGGGNATSGTALKLKMVSPRIKAARISNTNTDTVKNIIMLLAKVKNINIKDLQLNWQDGLPDDEFEKYTMLLNATEQPIMSTYSALKKLGLSDEQAEAEIEAIREDNSRLSPIALRTVEFGAE